MSSKPFGFIVLSWTTAFKSASSPKTASGLNFDEQSVAWIQSIKLEADIIMRTVYCSCRARALFTLLMMCCCPLWWPSLWALLWLISMRAAPICSPQQWHRSQTSWAICNHRPKMKPSLLYICYRKLPLQVTKTCLHGYVYPYLNYKDRYMAMHTEKTCIWQITPFLMRHCNLVQIIDLMPLSGHQQRYLNLKPENISKNKIQVCLQSGWIGLSACAFYRYWSVFIDSSLHLKSFPIMWRCTNQRHWSICNRKRCCKCYQHQQHHLYTSKITSTIHHYILISINTHHNPCSFKQQHWFRHHFKLWKIRRFSFVPVAIGFRPRMNAMYLHHKIDGMLEKCRFWLPSCL